MSTHDHSLRTPCNNCPFRTDIEPYLHAARARQIARGAERHELYCHKTTIEDEDGERRIVPGRSKVCAGMMICLERVNRPSQMMRISERLRLYDRRKLDMDAPVYESPEAFIEAYEQAERASREIRTRKRRP